MKLKVRHIQEGLKEMLYTAFHTFKNTAEQFGLLGDTKILKLIWRCISGKLVPLETK